MRYGGRWIGLGAALAGLGTAMAGEVTVKNDSFVSGGSASIVGGFVTNEEGGVRLTSPCNGTIVALQVAWLSSPPTGEFSLEAAIKVYRENTPSTFATPGPVALLLEGPVLTEGAINEFRFIDEDNTIPINVPVSAGEQFYVTLQFDSAPNPLNGDPSVIRDVNGCQAGKNVLKTAQGWRNFCMFITGDLVLRAVIDCPDPEGACCLPSGLCQVKSAGDCAAMGGTYQGDASLCANANCPQPTGACCVESTGGCVNNLTAIQCAGVPTGQWQGGGTSCATTNCFPEGACCLPDGSCVDGISPEDCAAQNGAYQGDDSVCANIECPDPVGACCFGTAFCLELSDFECGQAGGDWQGIGTDCIDGDGNTVADDCEGGGITCTGDLDGDGTRDLDDLLLVLGSFGCTSGCSGDVDGDGDDDLDDLLLLLGTFGQPCP